MTHQARPTFLFTALLLGTLAAAIACVPAIDSLRAASAGDETLYLPSANALKHLSLGYRGLMADIYWTRAVQYFGSRHHAKATTFPLLYPLLDITTQLDPQLTIAYEFGSIFLSQNPPEGAGLPQQAVVLVERGIRENPAQWRLYYHLGYIQALELHDYRAAAETFLQGSEIPGAYPWMKVMAAQMAQTGGNEETARFLWARIYESADDGMIRKNAADHLRAIQVERDVQQLEDAARAFHQQAGRWPASFADLVAIGWLRTIPVDPAGHAYRLSGAGHVYVQDASEFPFLRRGVSPDAKGAPTPELRF